MNIIAANGIELAYDEFGDTGDEVILLIAGLGTQMIRWTDTFCTGLSESGYRVIRYDNRDTGCSTHFTHCPPPDFGALAAHIQQGKQPVVPYTLHDMAADAAGLLDALSIGKAHVVGRSMGGMIAQMLASEYPERVMSLTSIMSSSGNPTLPQAAPDVMAMMMRPAPNPFAREEEFVSSSLAFARRITGSIHAFDAEAHRALVLEEARRAYDPAGTARQIAAMAVAGDRRNRLAAITVPTLVIHGADDPLIPAACGKDAADAIPNAEFMLIDGMGHDLPAGLYQPIIAGIVRLVCGVLRPRK